MGSSSSPGLSCAKVPSGRGAQNPGPFGPSPYCQQPSEASNVAAHQEGRRREVGTTSHPGPELPVADPGVRWSRPSSLLFLLASASARKQAEQRGTWLCTTERPMSVNNFKSSFIPWNKTVFL